MILQFTDLQAALAWNGALFLTLFLALLVQWREIRRRKLDPGASFLIIAIMAAAIIIGAKLVAIEAGAWASLLNGEWPQASSGKYHFGGILLFIPVYLLLRRYWKLPDSLADALFIALPLLSATTRIGCALAGCCHGIMAEGALSWSYGPGMPAYEAQLAEGLIPAGAAASQPVYAVQLFFLVSNLFFFLLLWSRRKKMHSGNLALWSIALVAFSYFWIGFFSIPLPGLLGMGMVGLTFAQWAGLLLAVAALLTLWLRPSASPDRHLRISTGNVAFTLFLMALLSLGLRHLLSLEESLLLLLAGLPVVAITLWRLWRERHSTAHRLAHSTLLSASVVLLGVTPADSLPPYQPGDQWLEITGGGVFGSYENVRRDCDGNIIDSETIRQQVYGFNVGYQNQLDKRSRIGLGVQGHYLRLDARESNELDRSLFSFAPYLSYNHTSFGLQAGPVLTSEAYTRSVSADYPKMSAYIRIGAFKGYHFDAGLYHHPIGLMYDEPRLTIGILNFGLGDPTGRTNLRLGLGDILDESSWDLSFRTPLGKSNFNLNGGLHFQRKPSIGIGLQYQYWLNNKGK